MSIVAFDKFVNSQASNIQKKVMFYLYLNFLTITIARNPKVWGSIPQGDSESFLCPTLVTRRKTSFSITNT